jgi:hypothetical protein
MLSPGVDERRDCWQGEGSGIAGEDEITAVALLRPLERFVFVMVILRALFSLGVLRLPWLHHARGDAMSDARDASAVSPIAARRTL